MTQQETHAGTLSPEQAREEAAYIVGVQIYLWVSHWLNMAIR